MFNLLPDIQDPVTVKSFSVKTNDELLVIYLSSMIRSVIALHGLIENKKMLRESEEETAVVAVTVPAVAEVVGK
jgi:26S proteasome regulatory subunit N8